MLLQLVGALQGELKDDLKVALDEPLTQVGRKLLEFRVDVLFNDVQNILVRLSAIECQQVRLPLGLIDAGFFAPVVGQLDVGGCRIGIWRDHLYLIVETVLLDHFGMLDVAVVGDLLSIFADVECRSVVGGDGVGVSYFLISGRRSRLI
jgi:hypothetical protein